MVLIGSSKRVVPPECPWRVRWVKNVVESRLHFYRRTQPHYDHIREVGHRDVWPKTVPVTRGGENDKGIMHAKSTGINLHGITKGPPYSQVFQGETEALKLKP